MHNTKNERITKQNVNVQKIIIFFNPANLQMRRDSNIKQYVLVCIDENINTKTILNEHLVALLLFVKIFFKVALFIRFRII